MTRPALATTDDLESALGEDIANPDQAEYLLRRASAIVRAYARATWLNADGALADVPDDVPDIVVAMVERATRNADGATQETAGPFSRSFGSDAAQRLFLTAPERSVLRFAIGRGGITTLCTTRGDLETPDVLDCWPDDTDECP